MRENVGELRGVGIASPGRNLILYFASALAMIPALATAALWVRQAELTPARAVLAVSPFVAALLPFAARTREQRVILRALAAASLFGYALLLVTSIGFIFIPAALLMGAASVRAFLR